MTLDTADPVRGLRQLARVFALLDDRLDLVEQDLDSDCEGSLAAAIGELRDEVSDLRAIVEEHVLGRVTDTGRGSMFDALDDAA